MKQDARCSISVLLFSALASWSHDAPAADEPKRPLPFHRGSATVVVLPDTEGYAAKRPETFVRMMKWVAANSRERNIAGVLHVGDITNNNTEREWKVARASFDEIEGKLPYVLAAGNHDYDNTPGRLTLMNRFFPLEEQKQRPEFGDVFEKGKLENHYQFLEIHGRKWIVLSLEMGPRRAVIDWADRVLDRHREHPAIILTHGYLYYDNQRYDHRKGKQRASPHNFYGEGADGEELWNALVRRHRNVMLVVCGHLSSGYVGYRADEGDYGNRVHQMMVDYEKMRGGGMGFLRLLEFLPDKKTVQVRTYSPLTGGTNPRDAKLEEFQFELRGPTRDIPRRIEAGATNATPLAHPPAHRYSFDGRAGGRVCRDSAGGRGRDGKLEQGAKLNGKGQLVLAGEALVKLPAGLLEDKSDLSLELWFTPRAEGYKWASTVRLGGADDWFHYGFRTLTTHRAEIAVDGHNEDIQQSLELKPGQALHVVVTYDADGAKGTPLLSYYRDGKLRGRMKTGLKLSAIEEKDNRIGPFEGEFDEVRIYAHPLTEGEVAGTYRAGPDKVLTAGKPAPGKRPGSGKK